VVASACRAASLHYTCEKILDTSKSRATEITTGNSEIAPLSLYTIKKGKTPESDKQETSENSSFGYRKMGRKTEILKKTIKTH
jgi:hypothetical protein